MTCEDSHDWAPFIASPKSHVLACIYCTCRRVIWSHVAQLERRSPFAAANVNEAITPFRHGRAACVPVAAATRHVAPCPMLPAACGGTFAADMSPSRASQARAICGCQRVLPQHIGECDGESAHRRFRARLRHWVRHQTGRTVITCAYRLRTCRASVDGSAFLDRCQLAAYLPRSVPAR